MQGAGKKLTLAFLVILLVVAGEGVAMQPSTGGPVSSGDQGLGPTLRLAKRLPLTLEASGFRRRERVRIVVMLETGTAAKRALADVVGSLVVVFPRLRIGRCDAFSARAAGNLGSRALLRGVPPACIGS